jgi:C4-dicarboxylate-specific signal transduction histidine kinase
MFPMMHIKKAMRLNFARVLPCLALGGYWQQAYADIFWMFREPDGATNWQYIANFSSSILIIALTAIAIRLYFSRRQARRYNRELEEIRAQLEQRVEDRTASLKQSHDALQVEIGEHRNTTAQLQNSEAYLNSILQSMPLMLIGLG